MRCLSHNGDHLQRCQRFWHVHQPKCLYRRHACRIDLAGSRQLPAQICAKAAEELRHGLFDADLGAGLFKKRIGREGQGKSGGFRTLIATNKADRWFFVYGFAKNERANIDKDEEAVLKKLAVELLSYTSKAINTAVEAKQLFEVNCDAKN